MTRLMKRTELGAIGGLILVTIFFLTTASPSMFTLAGIMNFLSPAAPAGHPGIAAALLMIGGEFDLSIGSMVAFAGMIFGVLVVNLGLPLILAIPLTDGLRGQRPATVNGAIVLRTGLPSFIVTLAFLFILRGASLVGLKLFTNGSTQLRGVARGGGGRLADADLLGRRLSRACSAGWAIGGSRDAEQRRTSVPGIPVEILWFLGVAGLATFVLLRTAAGNWIFATGGDKTAASNSACRVRRVKITLFHPDRPGRDAGRHHHRDRHGSTDARRGFMKEFEAIIAAVIGAAC